MISVLALTACRSRETSAARDAPAAPVDAALPPDAPPPADAPAPPAPTPTRLVAAGDATCAILSDLTVRCWGGNAHGQLGNGQTADAASPVAPAIRAVVDLQLADATACALLDDASVACWGRIAWHGRGEDVLRPTGVLGVIGVKQIFVLPGRACARVADDSLVCWGDVDARGHFAAGAGHRVPTPVVGLDHVAGMTADGAFSDDGRMWWWGSDGVPRRVAVTGVREIAAREGTVCGRLDGGRVACADRGRCSGSSGSAPPHQAAPSQAAGSQAAASQAAASQAAASQAAAPKTAASKAAAPKTAASKAAAPKTAASQAAASKTAASKAAASQAAASQAAASQAAAPKTAGSKAAAPKTAASKAAASKTAASKTAASKTAGSKTAASKTAASKTAASKAAASKPAGSSSTPAAGEAVQSPPFAAARQLAFDVGFCVVTTTGRLQCGDGCRRLDPIALERVDTIVHRCALLRSGTVTCFDGTKFVAVPGLQGATALAVGRAHACAITGRDIRCWGDNAHGQLGEFALTP